MHIILIFSSVFIAVVAAQIPNVNDDTTKGIIDLLKNSGQDTTGTALSSGGMFIIPKPTSTQQQQEKLSKELNGTIQALSSQTSNQTQKLESRIERIEGLLMDLLTKTEHLNNQHEYFVKRFDGGLNEQLMKFKDFTREMMSFVDGQLQKYMDDWATKKTRATELENADGKVAPWKPESINLPQILQRQQSQPQMLTNSPTTRLLIF